MNVLEMQTLEPVQAPGANRGAPGMITNIRTGDAFTMRVFGPGVVLEAKDQEAAIMVPWGNIRWARVEASALQAGKK
jgi:hypothetical protein